MNDLIEQKSWFTRNWKWLILIIVVFTSLLILLFSSKLGGNIIGIAKVYSESSVLDHAFEIAKKDKKVIQILGKLHPISKLAIVEGAHQYSNDYNTLKITVDVIGSKMENKIRSKMDIHADRNGNEWMYRSINIRIKKPEGLKQTIEILKQSSS